MIGLYIYINIQYLSMVDRYQSMVQDMKGSHSRNRHSSILLQKDGLSNLLKKTESHAANMKTCIHKYREATTPEAEREIVAKYKQEQQWLQEARQMLTKEYKSIDENSSQNKGAKVLVKEQLLKTVQRELKLDVQMNQVISNKEHRLEIQVKKFSAGSQKLKNALSDLNQKRNQIIYLQEQVRELVQLLEIVGILVFENTEKIESALEGVKKANQQIDKSLKVIDLAKQRSERSRKRMCCIVILGLMVIILLVVVLFVLKIIPTS